MTRPTFQDWALAGGGEIGAVYHIAGMPWATCSHPDIATALANTANADVVAYRKELFGSAVINSLTPSNAVQILPTLDDDLGTQTISYDDGKGLSGGDWRVVLARSASGAVYDYRTSSSGGSTPPGIYAGIDIMEDTLYDADIARATLSANYDSFSDTTISFGGEGAADLAALITANDGNSKLTYLWAGPMCIGVYNVGAAVDGVYTADCGAGAFRSPQGSIFMSVIDGGTTLMANAPHAGVVGMNAVLWLVELRNGSILGLGDRTTAGKPIMFRCGPVTNNPRTTPADVQIQHKHWLTWLDTEIPSIEVKGHLKGFRFCRQNTLIDGFNSTLHGSTVQIQMPHLMIFEYDGVSAMHEVPIWLTDGDGNTMPAGTSVSFLEIDDLRERAQIALDAAYDGGAGDLSSSYTIEVGDICRNSWETGWRCWVTGPVAWALGLGTVSMDTFAQWAGGSRTGAYSYQYYGETQWYLNVYPAPTDHWSPPLSDNYGMWRQVRSKHESIGGDDWDAMFATVIPPATYYYSYNWTVDGACVMGWDPAYKKPHLGRFKLKKFGAGWPITLDAGEDPDAPDPNDYRMHLDDTCASSDIAQDERFEMGHKTKDQIGIVTETAVFTRISSTGDNYVVPDVTIAANTWGDTGVPWIRDAPNDDPDVNESNAGMLWGADLVQWDGYPDPWKPQLANKIEADTLTELLLGLLGADPSNVGTMEVADVPLRRRTYHIPDLFGPAGDDRGGYGNHRQLIDWDKLEKWINVSMPSATYSVQTGGDSYKIYAALLGVMLSSGVRPVWEFCEAQRAWWLTFRPVGIISQAYAQQRGRFIDDDDITDAPPEEVYGNTWLYNSLELSCNYEGKNPMVQFKIDVETGRAVIAAGAETLEVKDYWSHIDDEDLEPVILNAASMIQRYAVAYPTVEITTCLSALTKVGAGAEISLTGAKVYDPYSATRGVDAVAAMITKCAIGISGNRAEIGLTLRMCPLGQYGWSPSLNLAAGDYTRNTVTITATATLATDPADNDYADPTGGLTDLACFGQFAYDESTDVVKLVDMGDTKGQRVRVITANVDSYYYTGANQNVWLGTLKGSATEELTLADVTAGSCTIVLDNANNYPGTTMDVVIIYAPRTDADIQPSQLVYGFLGDASGKVADSAGAEYRAMAWS